MRSAGHLLSRARLCCGAVALLMLASASIPAHAANEGNVFGFRFGAERFSVGEWVAYWTLNSIPGAQRDTVWQRIAVVARDSVGGAPAHWIEMATFRKTRLVMKALVLDSALRAPSAASGGVRGRTAKERTDDAALQGIIRIILKRGADEPIELRLPQSAALVRSLVNRTSPDFDPADIVRDDSLDLGEEDVVMPRGTSRGRHAGFLTVVEPGHAAADSSGAVGARTDSAAGARQTVVFATDLWTSSDVPITGMLRSVSRTILRPPDPGREVERSETFLDGYGIGATSEILGRVRLIDPPRTLVRPSR